MAEFGFDLGLTSEFFLLHEGGFCTAAIRVGIETESPQNGRRETKDG